MVQFAPSLVPVEAPLLAPPTISLLSSASVTDLPERELSGITYLPEGGVPTLMPLLDNVSVGDTPITPGTPDEWQGFGIVASAELSTFNSTAAYDAVARATRALKAHESRLIEQQLWYDPLGTGNPTLDIGVTNVTPGGSCKPNDFLAYLEQAAADEPWPGQFFIHVRPYLLNRMHDYVLGTGAIRRDGNRFLTAMDNVVVPGAGYRASGPRSPGDDIGDAQINLASYDWVMTTPPITVKRSKIQTFGTDREIIDRTTNTRKVYVMRQYLAWFDTTHARFAISVDHA